MTTTLNLPGSGTTAEDNGIRIYGPEIRGPARKVAIVFWGGIPLIYRYRQPLSTARPVRFGWFVAGAFLISLNFFADFGVWNVYPTLTGQSLFNAGMPAVIWELVQDSSWYLAQLLFAACIAVSVFPGRVRESVPSFAGH